MKYNNINNKNMKTKLLSLCLALLGVSAWANDVCNYNIYDDCSKNGYKGGYAPAPADVQAVDLGLPSGLKWASCNVGATTPEEYGSYYAWGEVLPKEDYSWATYKYANGAKGKLTKYCSEARYGNNGFTDNKTVLEPEDDAAHVNWGGAWRMPTDAEWTELCEQCTWMWTTQNGVKGYKASSKTNGNVVFFPAAGYRGSNLWDVGSHGYYQSSSLVTHLPYDSWFLFFDHYSSVYVIVSYGNGFERYWGFTVRPVCSSLDLSSSVDHYVNLTLYKEGCENANVIVCKEKQKVQISAVPENEHRHFVRWNDGNTDNPRTVQITQDITYTAYFAPNQYTISTEVSDTERGSVSGATTTDYLNDVTLTAVPNYGYHFAYWSDEGCRYWRNECNTDNPRTIQVTGDTTYTAVFEKNTYTITAQSANNIQGYVYAPYQAEYLDQVSLIAYPNVGYHFAQWADSNTDNPRTIVLTSDTTFTAEFAQTFSGQCGYDLYWQYAGHTLTISGTGAMYDYNGNDMPWLLFRDTTDVVVLEPGITHVGNNAFNGFVKVGKIELPSTLTSIGTNAFAGCRKLYDIYAYPTEPPVADNTSFANYNVNLYVPCDNLRDYQMDAVFGTFKYIQCMSTTDTEQVLADESADHAAQKLFRDGQVLILRGGKTYTLTGEEVE